MKSIKEDFSLMAILLIPVAVAINMAGFGIVKLLQLPIFLDTVGTIFISFLAGPWIGAIAAILTSIVSGMFDPVYLAYIPTSVFLALVAGFLARFKFGNNVIIKIAVSSLILTTVAVVVSAPITVLVFGGSTGNMTSSITGLFLASGKQIWEAVISSTIITEFADKLVTVIICILILKSMSSRYLIKFKFGEKYINKSKK